MLSGESVWQHIHPPPPESAASVDENTGTSDQCSGESLSGDASLGIHIHFVLSYVDNIL